MFLLSFIVSSVNATETRLVWTFFWEGLNVEVYAPYQAYPNETMTIRVRVEAREDLQEVTIRFRIYGSKSEGYLGWFNSFYAFYNVDLSSGVVEDQYFNVDIPEGVDPGLISVRHLALGRFGVSHRGRVSLMMAYLESLT